jgi:hypothetical protein
MLLNKEKTLMKISVNETFYPKNGIAKWDCDEWWEAARFSANTPMEMIPIITNRVNEIEVDDKIATGIKYWAQDLPGWENAKENGLFPLLFSPTKLDNEIR